MAHTKDWYRHNTPESNSDYPGINCSISEQRAWERRHGFYPEARAFE